MEFTIIKCFKGYDLFLGNKHIGTYGTLEKAESVAIEF